MIHYNYIYYKKHILLPLTVLMSFVQDWQQALQAQHDVNSSAEAVVDEREQEQRQQQIEQWYQTIRYDLRQMLPQEPPEGVAGNISVRVRLPNGDRVTRRFNSSERMEVC